MMHSIIDPYAYAVLVCVTNENRTRARLYSSAHQKARLEAMIAAGWLKEGSPNGYVVLTHQGMRVLGMMAEMLDDLGDDSWRESMAAVDATYENRLASMEEKRKRKRRKEE